MIKQALIMFALSTTATQAAVSTEYFVGTADLTFLPGGQKATERGAIVRTIDAEKGLLTEVMCGKGAGRPAFVSPVYMQVAGDSLTISDTPDFKEDRILKGTGKLTGPAWAWTFLSFDMSYATAQGSYRIVDVNFVTGSQIIARKQIYDAAGVPVELYDETMDKVDEAAYRAALADMGCPTN